MWFNLAQGILLLCQIFVTPNIEILDYQFFSAPTSSLSSRGILSMKVFSDCQQSHWKKLFVNILLMKATHFSFFYVKNFRHNFTQPWQLAWSLKQTTQRVVAQTMTKKLILTKGLHVITYFRLRVQQVHNSVATNVYNFVVNIHKHHHGRQHMVWYQLSKVFDLSTGISTVNVKLTTRLIVKLIINGSLNSVQVLMKQIH